MSWRKGPKGFYPQPNPRVISVKEEKTFEQYIDQTGESQLIDLLAIPLLKVSFEWVVDYAKLHDNYLPNRQTVIFSNTDELIQCLKLSKDFKKVPPDVFQKLVDILPESSWYCHPTYPATLYQRPA